ncbi:MAG: adenosylcobinamide-GDP ribazoletransferase [Acidobacteria bacterium]|nr:adenosylcobinamide-GDP ribazoletransferase [Acidobacteriota bacterium]
MIRQFVAAVSFLTRLPVGRRIAFSAEDVGKSSRWFPLVGALIGVVYVLAWGMLSFAFPAMVVALLILVIEALLTGALHLDGLADMADGFGGGRTREDVLRIMRDHAIGAYGVVALILVVVLKVASIAALSERQRAGTYLLIAPVLSRWSTVMLNNVLPYARRSASEGAPASGAVNDFVGRTELLVATLTALIISSAVAQWSAMFCSLVVVGVSAATGWICWRRIGGVTGDTLGANTEFCEVAVLLVGLATR